MNKEVCFVIFQNGLAKKFFFRNSAIKVLYKQLEFNSNATIRLFIYENCAMSFSLIDRRKQLSAANGFFFSIQTTLPYFGTKTRRR